MNIGVWSFTAGNSINNYMLNNIEAEITAGAGDTPFYGTYKLNKEAKKQNINLITLDMVEDISKLDALLIFDFPKPVRLQHRKWNKIVDEIFRFKKAKYLIISECEVFKPNNWILDNHRCFNKIFTWHDGFVDDKRYIKSYMAPRIIPDKINKNLETKTIFCTLVGSKKKYSHPFELFTERLRCIEWFDKNHPDDFELYGQGWNKYTFNMTNWFTRKFNRIDLLTKLLSRREYKTWKGSAKSKRDVLEKSKFNIAYENVKDFPGYITEKIFDSFIAGCIPIYLGANNVQEYIPEGCYIDKRKFNSYEALYDYMKNMSDNEYMKYINNIEKFLYSKKYYPFSVECYVDTIIKHISE